jgi:hypothetical protein
MLHEIVQHPERVHPGITLVWQPQIPCPADLRCCKNRGFLALRDNNCFYGALLTFDTTSGRIIYRIRDYNCNLNAWLAAWPD